jgi:hypothetical protein
MLLVSDEDSLNSDNGDETPEGIQNQYKWFSIEASTAVVENATHDGTLNAFPSEDDNDIEPEDCDCDGLGDFPCWPCVRAGRKELPN